MPGVGDQGSARFGGALSWANARGSPIEGWAVLGVGPPPAADCRRWPFMPQCCHQPCVPTSSLISLPPGQKMAVFMVAGGGGDGLWPAIISTVVWAKHGCSLTNHHHAGTRPTAIMVLSCSKTFLLLLACDLPPTSTAFSTFPAHLNLCECLKLPVALQMSW